MEKLLGYSDEICVAPNETISFKVSTPSEGSYQAELVRIRCADSDKSGPGFKEHPITAAFAGEHTGRRQPIGIGSYAAVGDPAAFALSSFSLQTLVWPTTPGEGEQSLIGTWEEESGSGYGLVLNERGCVCVLVGDGKGQRLRLETQTPLHARHWYLVAGSYDAETGRLAVHQIPRFVYAHGSQPETREDTVSLRLGTGGGLRMAAWSEQELPTACFNGKLERPRVAARNLNLEEIEALSQAELPARLVADVVAAWDFSREIGSDRIVDIGHQRLDAKLYNLPTRAVRGILWDGTEQRYTEAPSHYGAIHFHEDDLYDCGWDTDFQYEIPEDLPSGLYAAKLTQGEEEEYLPFYVRPPRGKPRAKLALLIPTASYCAYANYHINMEWDFSEQILGGFAVLDAEAQYLHLHPELGISTYDTHTDGSGGCYSSRLRPVLNMRPHTWAWQFAADTHIIDWLEEKEFEFDVFTDEELHREGLALLAPYACVMTGTHPEYYSRDMMNSLLAYQGQGGRLMYMGANGFYWKIDYHPDYPGVIEMRRAEDGSRGWLAEPGEYYHAFSGELGGLWRRNGIPPQAIAGSGFAAQGFDESSYFERNPDSFDPRASFIFEGVGAEEKIGTFGVMGGGAAGYEIDRADRELGTPPHALIVATASDFSPNYHWVKEEFTHAHAAITGTTCPHVRADMVFYETPKGGAVFSTSSIAWAGALSSGGYDNNVSRITENVVRRFLDPKPF